MKIIKTYQLHLEAQNETGRDVKLISQDISLQEPDEQMKQAFLRYARQAMMEVYGPLDDSTIRINTHVLGLHFDEPKTLVSALVKDHFTNAHSFVHSAARWFGVPIKDV